MMVMEEMDGHEAIVQCMFDDGYGKTNELILNGEGMQNIGMIMLLLLDGVFDKHLKYEV
jgi:hypothetical protein